MNIYTRKNNKVLLGLSGGVDSTAAALLLKQEGYQVTGMFFDVLGNQSEALYKAETAAKELQIDFIYRNVSDIFSQEIIDYFCHSYLMGETPNPCIKCNPTVKFKTMAEEADRIGAAYLATGHYARIYYDDFQKTYFVQKGENEKKDQSYMLYRLPQTILNRLLLPLGTVPDKGLTRELVRNHSIGNADTKDSQEICFIQDQHYIDYIKERISKKNTMDTGTNEPGDFIDKEGNVLGQHKGLVNYTIGQRKGLGITFGKPVFVIKIDGKNNTIILGSDDELWKNTVISTNHVFSVNHDNSQELPKSYEGKQIMAKIRYTAKPAVATIKKLNGDQLQTVFLERQRAATPGQSIVFYDDETVIGGGIITPLD